MNYLSKFSSSEQKLIGLAAILCVILGGWQFVIKPISSAKSQSAAKYDVAVRDYEIVQRALPRLTVRAPQSGGGQEFNRESIIATARIASIAISRVQPGNNGDVQVWFEETSSAQVYGFLQTLEGQYAVDVVQAQINRRESGRVSAQFTFTPLSVAGK